MNEQLVKNNYLVVRGLISRSLAQQLCSEFVEWSKTNETRDNQAPNSPAVYNHMPFLELLCELTPRISGLVDSTVLPTYCYARVYSNSEVLHRHRDRPACEISLTLHLGGDESWLIWIQRPDGEEVSVSLAPGDAMVYLGCTADHWREQFEGRWYAQVFLHYVQSRSGYAWAYFDKCQ